VNDLAFFLRLFLVHWRWLVAGILLALLAALAAIALLTLSGWFISAAALAGLQSPDGAALAFNFLQPAAEIRALAILRTLGRYAERLVTHEATFRVLAGVRVWFYRHLAALSPGQLAGFRSAEMLSRITADIDALDALYLRLLAPVLVAVLGVAAVLLLLSGYAPLLGMQVAMLLLLAGFGIPWLSNRLGRHAAKNGIVLNGSLRIRLLDFLQGLPELLSFGADDRVQRQLCSLSQQVIACQRSSNRITALFSAMTGLIGQSAIVVALIVGGLLLQGRQIDGAIMVMLVFCVIAVFELLSPLPEAWQMLGAARQAAHRVRSMAEMPADIVDPVDPRPLPPGNAISMQGVGYRYPGQACWLLENIHLEIGQGSKIAIVGNSGAGKTTLLHLLLRYLQPGAGRLLFSGEDYRQFAGEALLGRFALMTQRSQLLAASIGENILLARPDADRNELVEAVRRAGLQEFIARLPDGLQTWVGEQGLRVSGGEARRIALARLYLKKAPILLLDEPTEGLDSGTEQDVLAALEEFSADKTLLMVTHRSAGLQLVDEVYRLQQGRLFSTA